MHAHFLKVSVPEITRLYKRFKTLDKENKSRVSIAELMSIPELAMNPLSNRILAVFDSTESSDFNFKEFLSCLSVFSPHAKRETKLKCLWMNALILVVAFQVYDVNQDGFIDTSDLFTIVKLMVGNNLENDQVQQIVDQTILDADTLDVDGRISFDEFKRTMFAVDFEHILTITV